MEAEFDYTSWLRKSIASISGMPEKRQGVIDGIGGTLADDWETHSARIVTQITRVFTDDILETSNHVLVVQSMVENGVPVEGIAQLFLNVIDGLRSAAVSHFGRTITLLRFLAYCRANQLLSSESFEFISGNLRCGEESGLKTLGYLRLFMESCVSLACAAERRDDTAGDASDAQPVDIRLSAVDPILVSSFMCMPWGLSMSFESLGASDMVQDGLVMGLLSFYGSSPIECGKRILNFICPDASTRVSVLRDVLTRTLVPRLECGSFTRKSHVMSAHSLAIMCASLGASVEGFTPILTDSLKSCHSDFSVDFVVSLISQVKSEIVVVPDAIKKPVCAGICELMQREDAMAKLDSTLHGFLPFQHKIMAVAPRDAESKVVYTQAVVALSSSGKRTDIPRLLQADRTAVLQAFVDACAKSTDDMCRTVSEFGPDLQREVSQKELSSELLSLCVSIFKQSPARLRNAVSQLVWSGLIDGSSVVPPAVSADVNLAVDVAEYLVKARSSDEVVGEFACKWLSHDPKASRTIACHLLPVFAPADHQGAEPLRYAESMRVVMGSLTEQHGARSPSSRSSPKASPVNGLKRKL